LPKGQPLRLHCHSYLLVSPPSFELILSNVDGNLQILIITYLHINIAFSMRYVQGKDWKAETQRL
ncbi:hypothetical protein, partial [Enterocloster clostridioformis]|uniref:hypothetical protein n=1 Tax=Enterocloster clostridioformis TaxID=1531 RepID=UPI0032C0F794